MFIVQPPPLYIPRVLMSAANYNTIASDQGKFILHPTGDEVQRTITIASNATVPYPIGTCITFVNETAATLLIQVTGDVMYLAGTTTSGVRTLAQNGNATALKVTSTEWIISGTGLT